MPAATIPRQLRPTITSLAAQREAARLETAGRDAAKPVAAGRAPSPRTEPDRSRREASSRPDVAAPCGDAAFAPTSLIDDFDWADVLTLPRAAVRSRSRLGYAVSRSLHWGNGRRNLAVAGLLTCCALTAACGSTTRFARPETPATTLVAGRDAAVSAPLPAPILTPGLRAAGRATNRIAPAETRAAELRPDAEAPAADSGAPAPRAVEPAGERALTRLVAFQSAPFPYEGATPEGFPFLNVVQGEQRGHRNHRGQVLWESSTFFDNRVLVHVPARFDPSQPGAMVVFFHGYGATLSRDVGARQQVPQQVSASGANVVLVAPQFASDARDPSAGHFWEPGGCARFLDEAARQVADMRGIAPGEVARMPLVLVAYSGGFYTAALCLKDPAVARRTRDVLMLDAAYGELERYADWAASNRSNALVSGYTHFTARQNGELRALLSQRGVAIQPRLPDALSRGGATFLPADSPHNDYVTQAWTDSPIRDLLMRMPGLQGRDPQAVAAVDMTPTGSLR